MTRVFDEQRKHNSVTVLEMPFNTVVAQKKIEKDGYNALVIGSNGGIGEATAQLLITQNNIGKVFT